MFGHSKSFRQICKVKKAFSNINRLLSWKIQQSHYVELKEKISKR